jgi:hypothetical protein
MGNAIDKVLNKGPPFAPKCVPECTPGPNDLRGNICYKGNCVALCPIDSTIAEDGECLCTEDNAVYKDDNSKRMNDPSIGDGWGYCIEEGEETIVEDEDEDAEFAKELQKNPNMSEEEKVVLKKDIEKKVEKKKKEKKKQKIRFNPTSLFIDRTPKELDERVKVIVKAKLKENPKMTDEELAELVSQTTVDVVEELAVECEEEYKLTKVILSPKYGNGKWPTKEDLEVLIDTKNFPWLKSQVNQWPEEKSITSCQIISAVKDKITLNNRCIYSDDYPNMVEECNVDCGLGTEIREKKIIRQSNDDFPSLQPCSGAIPKKEFECDSGLICKEDCKLEINMKSFGEARCSKPCDSGDGPGEKTYKIKYVASSKGEPDDMGSCELDEEGKEEGQEYDVTVECNKEKCPDCEVKSKGPFKDNLVDYTGSININNVNKTFTKCLLPKEDGGFEDIDCGGAEGGHNYTKGARAKYNMTYNITKDDYGVQNCTKGEDIIEEGCSVNAFDPSLNPIVGTDGKLIKGGGEECGNECILSDDFPQLVMVEAKACSKDCGGGLQRMRKVVKSKSDAPYCPCKDDPSKCPYEEIPCNTQACIAPCVYGNEGNHVQINDMCPGVKGPNKHIVWDTTKTNAAGGKGMWFDSIGNKYYERSHFVKKMRVPTIKPPIGKGLCYQGDKADKTLQCSIEGTEKPVDAEWGPWKFDNYTGLGTTIKTITDKHGKWTFPKINTVKVGGTLVGLTVPGSGTVKWPSGGINKAVEEVKKMGHTLGKTVHYVEKRRNQIWLYKKGNASGKTGADTWEFQKGAEQNPNFGKKGEHCISEEGLGMAFPEELPGIRYTRDVKVFPEYGGKPATEIDGGNNIRVDSYMKKDGIIRKKSGTPAKNMSEAECKAYAKSVGLTYWVAEGAHQDSNPSGCQIWSDGNIKFNKKQNNLPCTSTGKDWQKGCIEKGPGGAGYTKYCPVDALLNPEMPIDDIDITDSSLGDESRCYTPNNSRGKSIKYTMKELEDEAKRRFVRDNQLPKYTAPDRKTEYRILGPGSRKIYRSKVRPEALDDRGVPFTKYGGLPAGLWHQKKENFGDVYDRRINEYDNCDGVDAIIKKIRKGMAEGKKNFGNWQSEDSIVKQVNCVPIYEWDGKFYKDKVSAQGIIEKKSGTPLKNMTEEECEAYAKSINKWGGSGKFNGTVPGCYRYKNPSDPTHNMNIFFNRDDNNTLCSNRDNCLEKIKYGTNDEEIVSHTDTGRKELSSKEKEKHPGTNMRKTNNGKFMTTHMHNDCQKPGLDSSKGWCGGLSTHDYIQMITGSGGIELIKGVVTQGRKDYDQWVTKFEVHVSRNGDSWKQMKNSSNQTEFTGNTDRSTKVQNYFNEVVEAKYIRFVTKAWHGYNSMRIAYIRDKSGAVKCYGGSGLLKTVVNADQPWFRFTFNEAKTKSPPKVGDAQYSQGTAASTKQCPQNGHVFVVQRGAITSGPNNIPVGNLKLLKRGYRSMRGYKDAPSRAMRKYIGRVGKNNSRKQKCFESCKGYNYFALQDGDECFCENDFNHATKYGTKDCGENGGAWCNYIYKYEDKVYGLKGEMSNEGLTGCGGDPTISGWRSSASGGSFKWSACVKNKSSTKADAFNNSDGGYRYMFRHWSGSDNNGYNRINNTTSYVTNTQPNNADNGSTYIPPSTNINNDNYESVNVIRQPCNRGTDYKNPTYDSKFYGETDGSTHSGGASKTYCAGGFKGKTGSVWKCINVNKDAVEGWSGNLKKKKWGTNAKPGTIANYVRDQLKSKFGSTDRNDLSFFKWGLKTIHPDCDKGGTSSAWDANWDCGGLHGKANMTNTGNKGYLRAGAARWGAPSTTTVKFNLGATYSVKGIYYKEGHIWGDVRKNLPRYWKIKVGSTVVQNANGGEIWALPETRDNQYILFDPNVNYSGSSVTFYDIHHGTTGLISFKASFFVKDTSKYSVWKNTSSSCTTGVHEPVDCKEGAAAGLEADWRSWTNRSVNWSYDAECSKDSNDKWSRKKRKKNGKQKQRYYKTTAAQHGGKRNCSVKLYDTKYDDIPGKDSCSWSYRSGVNEACYWIGSASYWGAREGVNWSSASSAAGQCKTLTNTKGRPYCHFLHVDTGGGAYVLETRNTCSATRCNRPGSGKCNTHGGWGGWRVD